jgi:hypothetical protein
MSVISPNEMENIIDKIINTDESNIQLDSESIADDTLKKAFDSMPIYLQKGNMVYKLEPIEEGNLTEVSSIKYKQLISDELIKYKRNLFKKHKQEVDRLDKWMREKTEELQYKEELLEKKLHDNFQMPDINFTHARAGISVVKGEGKNRLVWLIRAVYKPTHVGESEIEPAYVKKMTTPIIILITTEKDVVISVSTAKVGDLSLFDHYHQLNPDCWGQWKWKKTWSTPDDLLDIARQAQGVLSKINLLSIAHNNPIGLPKLYILKRHLIQPKEEKKEVKPDKVYERMSVNSLNSGWDSNIPF